ncbi:MAG: sulfite exporter TauE/SafE family protein, partial [Verrucomicrobia bacterium]|nr:sulfite exporter TauE/SafE family protein [Verrucomicrobiota bacterium]
GAGIGILMLAAFSWMGLQDIHEMNALKTMLGSLINMTASLFFAVSGLVDWPRAGVMTLGAIAGYYLGSRFSQAIPQIAIRRLVAGIGLFLSAATFYKEFYAR